MRIVSYLIILLIIIFGVSFAMLNADLVSINFYFGQRKLPLSLLLGLGFVLGCVLGMLVSCWLLIKAKYTNHRLRQRLQLAEKEIENLRAIPLQDKV